MITKERKEELRNLKGEEKLVARLFGSQEEKDFLASLETKEVEEVEGVEEKPLEKIEIYKVGGRTYKKYISERERFWLGADPAEAILKIKETQRKVSQNFNAWSLQPSPEVVIDFNVVVTNATTLDEEKMEKLVKRDVILPTERKVESNGYITATFRPVVVRRHGVGQNTSDDSMERVTYTKYAYLAIEWELVGVQNLQDEKEILENVGSAEAVIVEVRDITASEKAEVRAILMADF